MNSANSSTEDTENPRGQGSLLASAFTPKNHIFQYTETNSESAAERTMKNCWNIDGASTATDESRSILHQVLGAGRVGLASE